MKSMMMMSRALFLGICAFFVLASIAPFQSLASLTTPATVNSNAASDSDTDNTPALASDGNGTWVCVWDGKGANAVDYRGDDPATGPDGINQDLFFARSLDNGKTWSSRALLKTNAAADYADDIEPAIATDTKGHWMVVWRSRDTLNGTKGFDCDILMTYSNDNGVTWSAPAPVNNYAFTDPGGTESYVAGNRQICDDYRPSVASDKNGRWIVGWVACDLRLNWQASARVAYSDDNGAHWTDPTILQTRLQSTSVLNRPSLATDAQGRWIACWSSRNNNDSDMDLYYSISTNNGTNWGVPAMLNSNGGSDSGDDDWTSIATDGQGGWTVVWQSTDSLGGKIGTDTNILYSTSSDNGLTWSAPAPVNSNASTNTASDTSPCVIYDGTGNWVASWTSKSLGGDADVFYATLKQGDTAWSAMHPLNPWAATDSASDNTPALASMGNGSWMTVWGSSYNMATEANGDMDIDAILWQPDSSSSHTLTTPQTVNSDAATDSYNNRDQVVASGGDGVSIAVWVGPGPNAVYAGGNDSAIDSVNEDLFFARSLDHGKTWSTMAQLKANAASDHYDDLFPSITTDGQGHWMVVWQSKDPLGGTLGTNTKILCAYSADNGLSWSMPVPVNTDAATDYTAGSAAQDTVPSVCCDGQGHWLATWTRYDNRSGTWLTSAMAAASSNNGASWSAPRVLQTINDGGMNELGNTRTTTDRQGHWIVSWCARTSTSSDYDVYCTRSSDNSNTWSSPIMLNTNGASDSGDDQGPTIVTDGQGHWMACWISTDSLGGTLGTGSHILYATSGNNCATWSAPAAVNANSMNDSGGTVVYDGQGSYVVILQSQKLGGDYDVFYTTFKTGSSSAWAPLQPLNAWAATDSAYDGGPRVASDGLGNWVAVWSSTYILASGTNSDNDIYSTAWLAPPPSDDTSYTLTNPQTVNSDAATDSYNNRDQVVASGGDGVSIAVWVGPGPNAVYAGGNDSAVDSVNEDLFFARSLDHGKTWSTMAQLKANAASDHYDDLFPSITTDGQGHWMVVWQSKDPLGGTLGTNTKILCAYSADNGLSWSMPVPVNTDAATDYTSGGAAQDTVPTVRGDGQGHWVATWIRYDNRTGTWLTSAMVAVSSNNGATWSAPRALQTVNDGATYEVGNCRNTTDRQGHWVACWCARTSTISDFDIYCSLSSDNGATWSAPAKLNTNGNTDSGDDQGPWMATDEQGHWIACWVSWDTLGGTLATGSTHTLYATSGDNGATWSAPAAVNVNAANDSGATMVYDGQGNFVMTLMSQKMGGDYDVFYTTFKPGSSSAWAPLQPLNTWAANDSATDYGPRVASDGLGNWVAVWSSTYILPGGGNSDYDIYSIVGEFNGTPVVADQAPTAPAITISPTAPGTLDDIVTTATASDPDPGDYVVGYRFEWSLGGVTKSTSTTLSASLTTRGQQWTLKAWAKDSFGKWSMPGQVTFTIYNTPPTQPVVTTNPTTPGTYDNVVAMASATDPDAGDSVVAYRFEWWLDGVLKSTLTTLPASLTEQGQQWTLKAWARDAAGQWGPPGQTSFIVGDTPPAQPVVSISPTAPGTLDDIVTSATASDPDPGDSIVGYRFEWWLGGVIQSTSTTLPASLTTRGQQWTLKAWAEDRYGQWSLPGQLTFTIANTPPTQPIVTLRPKPAQAGQDLVVDVQVYSTDPDGDTVAYDFSWFKSTDGGTTWIHKTELDGSPQVSGQYISNGEIWEVHYTPYEKNLSTAKTSAKTATLGAGRVEGKYGWDRAYIGVNAPPALTLETPLLQRQRNGTMLNLGWSYNDADGDACTLDLEWINAKQLSYKPLATGLTARQGTYRALVTLPLDSPLTLHGIIRDAKGAVTQVLSVPARVLPPDPKFILDYLLGRTSDPNGLDVNQDHAINVVDTLGAVAAIMPDIPVPQAPLDGVTGLTIKPTLRWTTSVHGLTYQVYLWPANTPRPAAPSASGLTTGSYMPSASLARNTSYCWQVIAVDGTVSVSGPVRSFKTLP